MTHSDRDLAILLARKLVELKPLILDTETTGLDSSAEVVELAIVDIYGRVLMNSMIKPRAPVPARATEIHGITDAMLEHEPAFADVWALAKQHLQDREVVIYNADYDRRIIAQSKALNNVETTHTAMAHTSCMMHLYAQYYGEWRRGSYSWQSLNNALSQQGIKLSPSHTPHRALADAEATRLLLLHIAAQELETTTEPTP